MAITHRHRLAAGAPRDAVMPRKFATVRLALSGVICAAAGFALLAGIANAQCVTPGPAPWPTQFQFVPANPMSGQPIQLQLGPVSSLRLWGTTVAQTGQDIIVTGNAFLFAGIPPPNALSEIVLGSFPAGSFQVRLRFRQNGADCPEVTVPLLVGLAPAQPVSTLGDPIGQVALGAGLLLAAGWAGRPRRRAIRS